jgi:hypothetical protein
MRITLLALGLVMACGPGPRGSDDTGDDGGDDGGDDTEADAPGPQPDGVDGNCPQGAELVYTLDQFNARISTFDPPTGTFQDLGSLACPAGGATPFSMSVDRQANAWVLYNSGQLFQVQLPGLSCTPTGWTSQAGLTVFGMGFSTDTPGGTTETLFVGGGLTQTQTSFTFASIDLATMTATPIGTQTQLPEMTGTGNAELWGFMPDATTARVVKFDKPTGAIVTTYPQPTLAGTNTGYAFAHWGGDFWVFLIKNAELSTTVYQVDGATGQIVGMTPTTGRTIVGAGVSTCAPIVIE